MRNWNRGSNVAFVRLDLRMMCQQMDGHPKF